MIKAILRLLFDRQPLLSKDNLLFLKRELEEQLISHMISPRLYDAGKKIRFFKRQLAFANRQLRAHTNNKVCTPSDAKVIKLKP